jgi:hypothetical protein
MNKWVALALKLAALMLCALAFAPLAAADDDNPDGEGEPSIDQTEPAFDDVDYGVPASSIPQSPSGSAGTGTYTTERWSVDDTETEGGVDVVNSTNVNTAALSGSVIDASTGAIVPNARLTILWRETCPQCQVRPPEPAPAPVTTYSSASGGFAFIHIRPKVNRYYAVLEVVADGYGKLELIRLQLDYNATFQTTIMLDETEQVWDDRLGGPSGSGPGTTENGSGAGMSAQSHVLNAALYGAHAYVPPMVKVREYKLNQQTCARAAGAGNGTVRWFRWRYYVLRVAAGEISGSGWPGGFFDRQAMKANFAVIQNYAWRKMLEQTDPTLAAVNNTTEFQCFPRVRTIGVRYVNEHPIGEGWASWLNEALANRVVDEDVSPKTITFTEYKGAGSGVCGAATECYNAVADHCIASSPPSFQDVLFDPFTPHQMSQLGAKAAEEACGLNQQDRPGTTPAQDWKRIVNHYYDRADDSGEHRKGSVQPGLKPPVPQRSNVKVFNTTGTVPAGFVKLSFRSTSYGHNVGWQYFVVRTSTFHGPSTNICCKPKSAPTGGPQTTVTYWPPPDATRGGSRCYYYRVRAWNPVGPTAWTDFIADANYVGDDRKLICPA